MIHDYSVLYFLRQLPPSRMVSPVCFSNPWTARFLMNVDYDQMQDNVDLYMTI